MNLYAVKINYKNKGSVDIDSDNWYFGCDSEEELRRIMSINKEKFDKYGMILLNYSFKNIKMTDNGYAVILENR